MNDFTVDLASRLTHLAATGKTISYGALAAEFGVRVNTLTKALEILMEEENARGEPLRAVLCFGRLTDGLPARGFYEKATALGYVVDNADTFASTMRKQLFLKAR